MRTFLVKAAAAAVLALAASPLSASTPADFEARLGAAIDANMDFPAALERSHSSGVATVRFGIAADGATVGVELVESSGNPTIDRAARRTIATLRLPAGSPAGPHEAVLLYGTETSFADRSRLADRLASAENRSRQLARFGDRERLARRGGGNPVSTIQ